MLTTTLPEPASSVSQLHGAEGNLVLIRIAVEPRQLEDVLEIVAELPFPINPAIQHRTGMSEVEFPAYSTRVAEVRDALLLRGFGADDLRIVDMFEGATSGG